MGDHDCTSPTLASESRAEPTTNPRINDRTLRARSVTRAKQLATPFKLAITGTPLENNLSELWALCSTTAPGLFPRLDRFTDYYRTPIEKGQDRERLAQLQRRVKPRLLRRRKNEVAVDLPPKQEQILELELDPRHRFEIFRSLTLLRQASLDVALVDPKHHRVPSAKLDALSSRCGRLPISPVG